MEADPIKLRQLYERRKRRYAATLKDHDQLQLFEEYTSHCANGTWEEDLTATLNRMVPPAKHGQLNASELAKGIKLLEEVAMKSDSLEEQPPAPILQPPLNAEFLLHLLLRHDEHDAVIGDMIERYGKKCARLGRCRANCWFYAEVFWTALPLIKRALFKVSGLMTLAEFVRRHIS